MTRTLTAAILVASLALAGCATTGGLGTGILSPASPQAATPAEVTSPTTVSKVQDVATQVCGYVPAVSTVTNILSMFISGAPEINALATNVAKSICSAVVPKRTLARGRLIARPPSMQVRTVGSRTLARPVPVEGAFVR